MIPLGLWGEVALCVAIDFDYLSVVSGLRPEGESASERSRRPRRILAC